jgi:hypothetical protein
MNLPPGHIETDTPWRHKVDGALASVVAVNSADVTIAYAANGCRSTVPRRLFLANWEEYRPDA